MLIPADKLIPDAHKHTHKDINAFVHSRKWFSAANTHSRTFYDYYVCMHMLVHIYKHLHWCKSLYYNVLSARTNVRVYVCVYYKKWLSHNLYKLHTVCIQKHILYLAIHQSAIVCWLAWLSINELCTLSSPLGRHCGDLLLKLTRARSFVTPVKLVTDACLWQPR